MHSTLGPSAEHDYDEPARPSLLNQLDAVIAELQDDLLSRRHAA